MQHQDKHISDPELLLDIENELPAHAQKRVQAHLDLCWRCRTRRQELETAIADFVRAHQQEFEAILPLATAPRAMLKARLSQVPRIERAASSDRRFTWAILAMAGGLAAFILYVGLAPRTPRQAIVLSVPDARLTPGATLLENRQAVCAQANIKNKAVPVALQREVFAEYGLRGESHGYEVDYLVTPALGGAEDIHKLLPHSYSATVWNAKVKDELEDRLREMVCNGSLDLAEAQREIASNWIGAYKKYFHTNEPLQ